MIPIASGIENDPIFVLRDELDADLISQWNLALPGLSSRCLGVRLHHGLVGIDEARITSLHLFRVGFDESSSRPTIIINTSLPLDSSAKKELQAIISLAPIWPACQMNRSESLQILFRKCKVRRSVGSMMPLLPPICQPRNRHFSRIPSTGASIGIAGSIEDTATLGCYVLVGSILMALTVDHLAPRNSPHLHLTHVSEQDRFEMILQLSQVIRNLLIRSNHSCGLCAELHFSGMSDEEICAASHDVFKAPSSPSLESCSFQQALKAECQPSELYRVLPIAIIFRKSGTRCQGTGPDAREMDWALFKVDGDFSVEVEQLLVTRHHESVLRKPGEMHMHDSVKPGAWVRSLGRTSGHQHGVISTTMSAVFHEDYVTQEWRVIKRPENSLDEWIKGGIGVEGDSGALIVDEEDDGIYGMLWGRTGDGPATMTIFTPMREILRDIRERTGADMELLRGQKMPRPENIEVTEAPQVGEGVPITISIDEKGDEIPLEQAAYSLESWQQSSADTRHPHSFERYRGRDKPNSAVPRNAAQVQCPEENTEGNQWPGVHTYVRYVLAPEQE